MIFSNSI